MLTYRRLSLIFSCVLLISFFVNGVQNCPSSCQDANKKCIPNCQDPAASNTNDNSANVVTLNEGAAWPSGLQNGAPAWPRNSRTDACRGADASATKELHPGKVTGITTECEEATIFEKKKVSIKWGPPEKYKTHRVSGYEISYKIVTDNVIDPFGMECIYRDNKTRGLTFPTPIGKNQHLQVTVIALPSYPGLSTPMTRAVCLEEKPSSPEPSTSAQGNDDDDDDRAQPLDIAVIVGSVTGSLLLLVTLAVFGKVGHKVLIKNCKVERFQKKDKEAEKYSSGVSIALEEKEEYQRQFTRESYLRSSLMTIKSDQMEPGSFSDVVDIPNTKVDCAKCTKVYISYYPDSDDFKTSLLALVARLHKHHNISVIIDELDNRTIDKLGLANWCTANLTKADKIMMVISPKYIEALKYNDTDDNNKHLTTLLDRNVLRKIRLETHYINSKLFVENQRGSSLVVLLAGTKETDLPPYLSGRSHYQWPTLDTDSERKLLYCLNEVEDLVV